MADLIAENALEEFSESEIAQGAMKVLAENPLFEVGNADIGGNNYRIFKNAPPSLVGLFMHGSMHGDREFLIFEDESLSHKEVWSRACRLAHALSAELGVKKGDRVAIAMRNYPEWCISYMAIVSLGAVVVPLNAWWKTDELEYGLKDCAAKIVVVDAKRLNYIQPIKDSLGLTLVLAREETDGADFHYEKLLAGSETETPPAIEILPEDVFCISYTSGSTGDPKGVILNHRSVVSALLSWAFLASIFKELRGGISAFGDDPGILLGIPLFHVTGSHSIFMFSWLLGRRVAMTYRWDPIEAAEVIRKHKLTNFVGVPSQSYELIEASGPDGLPSLLDIGSGGAKRPPEHVKQLKEKFSNANPSSGYGLTETNAIGCLNAYGNYQKNPDAAGRVVPPLTDIKVVLKDGSTAAAGIDGEVWIRGVVNFDGYLNKEKQTTEAVTADGWFKTGDVGRFDEGGLLYIVDRLKDLIIRGGENISCIEVENRAYEHKHVAEAAVFSVPCDVLGERVGLVVFPKTDQSIDPAELRDFIARGLAGFKVPERIWISPVSLPRLGTEKFDKRTVKMISLQHLPALSV